MTEYLVGARAENVELKARIAMMKLEKTDLENRMKRTENKLSDFEKLIREKLTQLK